MIIGTSYIKGAIYVDINKASPENRVHRTGTHTHTYTRRDRQTDRKTDTKIEE